VNPCSHGSIIIIGSTTGISLGEGLRVSVLQMREKKNAKSIHVIYLIYNLFLVVSKLT